MKTKVSYALLAVNLALATLAIAQHTPSAVQTVPRLMKFSGKLGNTPGSPAGEVAGVTFALYKVQEGGTPLWMETQNVHPDAAGRYTVTLGDTKPSGIPAELFASGEAQWLGVQAQGETEQPRVLLMSVPYALKALDAETIGGKPASAFALATPLVGPDAPKSGSATQQSTSRHAAPPISGSGTPGYLSWWTSGTNLGNSALFQKNGNIGLGTINPTTSTGGRVLDIENPSGPSVLRLGDASTGGTEWEWQSTVIGKTGAMNLSNLTNSTNPLTVLANGKVGIGTTSPILARLTVQESSYPAIYALSDQGDGVLGLSHSTTASGVVGVTTTGTSNAGVSGRGPALGVQGAATAAGGTGVQGTGVGAGVVGHAVGTADVTQGVAGYADSPSGIGVQGIAVTGGQFETGFGNELIGRGQGHTNFRVDSTGKVFSNGGYQTSGADFAESFAVRGDRTDYRPGDLLMIDRKGDRQLALAHQSYSKLVAGIYSTKPGLLGTTHGMSDPLLAQEIPLAVVGVVPCKVTAENGPIRAGDLLVSSSTPGHAMKGTDQNRMLGAVVGKALGSLAKGRGVVNVLVTLQ